MVEVERDEDSLGYEGTAGDDALTAAINSLIAIVFERLPDVSSAEHKALMVALLDFHRQLRSRPSGARLLN
jgi:hypothetical protein